MSEASPPAESTVTQVSTGEAQELKHESLTHNANQVVSVQPAADQESNQAMVDQLLQDIASGTGATYIDAEMTEITLDSPLVISYKDLDE